MAKGFFPHKESADLELENNTSEPYSDSSRMSSFRSGLPLPLQQMAIPIYTAPSQTEVEVGGRVLFHNFIQQEMLHHGLSGNVIEIENPPADVFEDAGPDVNAEVLSERAASPALFGSLEGYNNQSFSTLGATIRDIANQFEISHQRTLIREQADQVDLGRISYDTFNNLLNELFRNGIDNKYCIVALFYFCSDVLIRCVKNELHRLGSKLFFWALDFLIRKVCKWVYENGGWERVFSQFYNFAMKVSAAVALGVVIICGIIFIRKNM